jgi:hypothetical protein
VADGKLRSCRVFETTQAEVDAWLDRTLAPAATAG